MNISYRTREEQLQRDRILQEYGSSGDSHLDEDGNLIVREAKVHTVYMSKSISHHRFFFVFSWLSIERR